MAKNFFCSLCEREHWFNEKMNQCCYQKLFIQLKAELERANRLLKATRESREYWKAFAEKEEEERDALVQKNQRLMVEIELVRKGHCACAACISEAARKKGGE